MLDFASSLLILLFGNTTIISLPSLSFPLPFSPFRFGPTAIGPCAHEQKAHMAYMHHEFSRHWLQIGCICDLDLKHWSQHFAKFNQFVAHAYESLRLRYGNYLLTMTTRLITLPLEHARRIINTFHWGLKICNYIHALQMPNMYMYQVRKECIPDKYSVNCSLHIIVQ